MGSVLSQEEPWLREGHGRQVYLHSLREPIRTHKAAHACERFPHTFLKTFEGAVTLIRLRMTGLDDMPCYSDIRCHYTDDFNGRRMVGYDQYMLYTCR